MNNKIINPFFNEFPDDVRDRLIERSKNEIWLYIMNKAELEKELAIEKEKEEKEQLKRKREMEGITADIEMAITKLGKENVLGPKEIEKTLGVRFENVPEIQFSHEELERAKEMEQILILRVDRIEDGKPMSLEAMNTILAKRWEKEKKEGLLNTAEGWRDKVTGSKDFSEVAPRAGWALISKELLKDSTSKNYIEQTEVIIKALREQAFKDMEMPEEYEEAIKEFEANKGRLTKLMSENWQQAAKELAELKITQLTRQSIQETIYDLALYYDTNGKRLLPNAYTWSNSRSTDGGLVDLGLFGKWGVVGGSRRAPDYRGGALGVLLSRRR